MSALRSSLPRRPRSSSPRRTSRALVVLTLLLAPLVPLGVVSAAPAQAASNLTIRPITWDVIGIDSNKPSDAGAGVGPNVFPVGARVCNTGADPATGLRADLLFGGDKVIDNPYLSVQGSDVVSFGDVAAGACVDAYFNVQVKRVAAAYDTVQRYTIVASATNSPSASTPSNRQLYVEHLISQNRNNVQRITGPTTVYVGGTYSYHVDATTATQGYEQLESFLTFPNTIFQLLSARTTYTSAPTTVPNDTLYADSCTWDPNIGPRPPQGTYLSCLGTGKAGGTISMDYTVKVTKAGSGTLSSLIYDYSGSSFHYNGDYGTPVNALQVTTVNSDMALTKTHSGTFQRGANAAYTLTATNAGSATVSGPFTLTDTLPPGLTYVAGTGTGYSCTAGAVTASGQPVTCTLAGPINAGGTRDLLLTVAVGSTTPDPVVNTAVLSQGTSESNTANNTATDTAVVNSAPVASPDTVTTNQATAVTLDPRTGDTDPDGDVLTVVASTATVLTAHGSVTCSTASCTYTPASGFAGTDTFRYSIADGRGGTDSSTVTVVVVNRPPSFTSASTNSAQTVTAGTGRLTALAATDPDGNALTYGLAPGSAPLPAGVTLAADGTFSGSPTTPGTYDVVVQVSDGFSDGTVTQALRITVVAQQGTVSVNVFSDYDRDKAQGPAEGVRPGTTVQVLDGGGKVVASGPTGSDGTATFTLPVGTYSFTAVTSAGQLITTAPSAVAVTAGPNSPLLIGIDEDRAPVAVDDTLTTPGGTARTFDPRTNDTDPDQDPISVVAPTTATTSAGGSVTCSDTSCTYTPKAGYEGPDSFRYTIQDGVSVGLLPLTSTATVSFTVGGTPPSYTSAGANTGQTVTVGSGLAPLSATDPDQPANTLTYTLTGGTLPPGITALNTDGTFSGTATTPGTTSVTVTVTDAYKGTATTTLVVVVNAPPTVGAPVAKADSDTTDTGKAITVAVLANDTTPSPVTVSAFTQPTGNAGTVVCDTTSGTSATTPPVGCTFTPTQTFAGTTSFTYTITDGTASSTATVTIVVNTPPAITSPANRTVVLGGLPSPLTATDVDGDAVQFRPVTGATLPPGVTGIDPVTGAFLGATTTPGVYVFDVLASDTRGGSTRQTVTVTVNTPPAFTSSPSNTTQTVVVGGALAPVAATDPENEAVTYALTAGTLPAGVSLDPNGTFTGSPTAPGTSTVTVTATDARGASTSTQLQISVVAPASVGDLVFVDANGNGVQDGTESGATVPVTVVLTGTDGATRTATSGSTGAYTVAGLLPGDYTVSVSGLPAGYVLTSRPGTVTVSAGQVRTDVDLGVQQRDASVPVLLFRDDNGNGAQDGAEPGLSGVSVTLSAGGSTVATVATSSSGTATFSGLAAGSYTVSVPAPAGTGFTTPTTTPSTGTASRSVVVVAGQPSAVQVFGVRVAPTPPVATDDSVRTSRDTPVSIDVLANDTSPSGGTLTVAGATSAFVLNADGTRTTTVSGTVSCSTTACRFTPATGFSGAVAFDYTDSDGNGTDVATVTVLVGNNPPAFTAASVNTAQDVPSGGTLSRVVATDLDGDPVTYTVVPKAGESLPPNVGLSTDGTFTGTPVNTTGSVLTYTVTIRATSAGPLTADTVLVVRVLPANRAPSFTSATTNSTQDVLVGQPLVALAATDPDGDALGYSVTAGSLPPGVTLSANGVLDGAPTAAGTYTVTVQVIDPGKLTGSTTLTIRVDTPPVAADDAVTTTVDTPLQVQVLTGDTDADGDTLSVAGPRTVTPTSQGGTVTCTTSGCTYTPKPGFVGSDTFSYTVSDGRGGTDTGLVTVDVRPTTPAPGATNLPPVFGGPTSQTVPVGGTVAPLRATDPEGGTVTTVLTGGVLPPGVSALQTDGSFVGTPSTPGTYQATVVLTDPQGATTPVTITIVVPDAPPVARDDAYTVPAGATTSLPVLLNDSDAGGGPVTVVSNTATATGTVTCAASSCSYTAPAGAEGATVSFGYTIADSANQQDTATVTIVVGPAGSTADLPPAFTADPANTAQSVPVGGALTPVAATDDRSPVVYSVDPGTLPPGVTGIDPATGAFTGRPTTPGTYPVLVTATAGGASDTTTVVVTVTDTAPVARDDSSSTAVGTPVTFGVLGNDTDADPGQTLTVVAVSTPTSGSVTCSPSGTCTYVPGASPGSATFTYTVSDGAGQTAVATVTVTVTAAPAPPPVPASTSPSPSPSPSDTPSPSPSASPSASPSPTPTTASPSPTTTPTASPVATPTVSTSPSPSPSPTTGNRAPVAVDDTARTTAGTAVLVPVLGNDSDPDGDPLTVSVARTPAHGAVTCTTTGCRYVPRAGFAGTDTFTYTVSDGNGGTDTATVTVTVAAGPSTNRPPVAGNDAGTTTAGTAVVVPVLGNDTDPDGDVLTVAVGTRPAHGGVTCTGSSCTYTPDAGYTGTDAFTYTVSDGRGGTDTATVTVTVTQGPPSTGGGGGAGDADGDGIPDALDPTPYGPGSRPLGNGSGTGLGSGSGSGTGTGTGRLARTGSDTGLLATTGGVLVLLGGMVLVVARPTRRRLTTT